MTVNNEWTTIPTLETNSYKVIGLERSHAEALFPILTDKMTMRYITPNPIQSREELEDTIDSQLRRVAEKNELPWVIQEKAEGKVIGTVRFHKIRLWHRSCEIGVVVAPEFQRKGVMTELIPCLLDFGFNQLQLNRIVGDIFAGNVGSRKLLERFGFIQEGILRQTDFDGELFHDTIVYSMLKEEYARE